jgi:hypothetical protein
VAADVAELEVERDEGSNFRNGRGQQSGGSE